jgi:hypothetical protein
MRSSRKRSVGVVLGIVVSWLPVTSMSFAQMAAARPAQIGSPALGKSPAVTKTVSLPGPDLDPWPSWADAVTATQASGRPTVLIVTSRQVPRSMEYARRLRADRSMDEMRQSGAVEFAELVAEESGDQVARLQISQFPTILAYRQGARGLETAGRLRGSCSPGQISGWMLGIGLVATSGDAEDVMSQNGPQSRGSSAGGGARVSLPDLEPAHTSVRTSVSDPNLQRASHDATYPSPQYQGAPPYNAPQAAPPQPQAPVYQVLVPQSAPPQSAPLQGVPVTVNVPQQVTISVPQQAMLVQQAPPQAAPLNLLSAPPVQATMMAAPPQQVVMAAPTQSYVMAAPPQQVVMAAPTQSYVMAAPTQSYVMAAPAQTTIAAAPAQGGGLTLPGLNIPGANLSLRSPGFVDRFVGKIGKKLREHSYPRVAIDIEAAEAAAEANEVEVVVEKQIPRRVSIQPRHPKTCPPPAQQPQPTGPMPSPQSNTYPPVPSSQQP